MSTLTTRYVHAVVRRLPEGTRDEVSAEVTAMIADMIEARTESPASHEDSPTPERDSLATHNSKPDTVAEAAVLEELGSPESLAQKYSRAPQYLIGPTVFPVYRWALTWLLPLVVAVALTTNGIVYALTAPEVHIGGLIGTAIGRSVPALLVAFASLTVLFAVYERVGTKPLVGPRTRRWSVDQLQTTSPSGSSVRADGIVSLVMLVLLAALPLLPTTLVYVGHLNGGETFVNPDLGIGWLIGYWALLALLAVTEAVHTFRGTRTTATTMWGVAIDLVMAIFLTIALTTQDTVHPDLAAQSDIDIALWLVVIIWAITVWDQVSTIRSHRSESQHSR